MKMSESNSAEENKQSIINNNETSSNGSNTNATLKERIEWALNKPEVVIKKEGITKGHQIEILKNEEKKWGNKMIGQENNGQRTTL